jgi:hypothetical protein
MANYYTGLVMALTKCKECGGNLSSEAPACVHCGAKNAVPNPMRGYAYLALIIIGIVVWCVGSATPDKGVSHRDAAVVACSMAVKDRSRYGAESEWGFTGEAVTAGDVVEIRDQGVSMRNGFNALARMDYRCRYNLKTGRVSVLSLKQL